MNNETYEALKGIVAALKAISRDTRTDEGDAEIKLAEEWIKEVEKEYPTQRNPY